MQNLTIYTGHGPIIGGDAKFIIDLVNDLDPEKYRITFLTDRSATFAKRLEQWGKPGIAVQYLDTAPSVDSSEQIYELYRHLEVKERRSAFESLIFKILDLSYGHRKFYQFLQFICAILSLRPLRVKIINLHLFWRFFRKNHRNIDIFHVNNGGYPGKEACLIAIIVAGLFRIDRIVLSIHNIPGPCRWYRPSDRLYDFCVSRFCDVVIPICEAIRSALLAQRRLDPSKMCSTRVTIGLRDQLPLPLAARALLRRELGLADETVAILVCGNLDEERKGHEPLLRALHNIRQSGLPFVLLVAGSGGARRILYLKQLVSSLDLADHVQFLGYRADTHELNCAADIVTVPSIGVEGIPFTILEACRAGACLITTTAGGCAEPIDHDESGFVVKLADIESLAAMLYKLISNRSLRETSGHAARKKFLAHYLWALQVKKIDEIFIGSPKYELNRLIPQPEVLSCSSNFRSDSGKGNYYRGSGRQS